MIKVEQSAKTLDEGIKNLMAGAKKDYEQMSTSYGRKELTGYSKEQVDFGIVKQKLCLVKSTLRLYKILVFFVLSQKKTLNILKKVIYWKPLVTMRLL